MKYLTQKYLAMSAGVFLLGSVAITTAHADPIVSAEAVLSFEDFQIKWKTSGKQLDNNVDLGNLSVTSSQLTAASVDGIGNTAHNPSSSDGSPLTSESVIGTVDPAITGVPGTLKDTVFNVPNLPLTGNFSASASNENGSPILNFGPNPPAKYDADLHNASYASLDTLAGSAGTSTSSTLASTVIFKALSGGDKLEFDFKFGAYIGAFLTSGAAQSATAAWSLTFSLQDKTLNDGMNILPVSLGDTISNNKPGTGVTEVGSSNSTLTGGIIDLTNYSFTTTKSIVAGHQYLLSANLTTRAQVQRVPEPGFLALLSIGLLGLVAIFRKKGEKQVGEMLA